MEIILILLILILIILLSTPDEQILNFNKSQIPWGENPSQTEVILFNNNSNFLWGLSEFAFNYSPFWNNYFYSPFQFGFNGFMSPWSNFPMWSPYGRYADFWRFRGYDTFYNPYIILYGFYNPYGLGFGFGIRNNWFNRYYNYNRFNDYYGNNIRRSGSRSYRTTIARINSGRGERSNRNSNSQLINKFNNNNKFRSKKMLKKQLLDSILVEEVVQSEEFHLLVTIETE